MYRASESFAAKGRVTRLPTPSMATGPTHLPSSPPVLDIEVDWLDEQHPGNTEDCQDHQEGLEHPLQWRGGGVTFVCSYCRDGRGGEGRGGEGRGGEGRGGEERGGEGRGGEGRRQ